MYNVDIYYLFTTFTRKCIYPAINSANSNETCCPSNYGVINSLTACAESNLSMEFITTRFSFISLRWELHTVRHRGPNFWIGCNTGKYVWIISFPKTPLFQQFWKWFAWIPRYSEQYQRYEMRSRMWGWEGKMLDGNPQKIMFDTVTAIIFVRHSSKLPHHNYTVALCWSLPKWRTQLLADDTVLISKEAFPFPQLLISSV